MAFLLGLLAVLQITSAQAEKLRWVPNPRVANSTWVSDPSHHLRPATVDSLNAMISALNSETGAEIAVVAIDSTSRYEPFDVALALHRMWGVGQRGRDNGVLLLWVPTQRAVQISVGYGLEGVLPDARAGRIRDQEIFPAFKRGNFDAGMLAGVAAIAKVVREEKDARGSTMTTTSPRPNVTRPVEQIGPTPASTGTRARKTGIALGIVGAGLGLAGAAAGTARYRRRRPRKCPRGHGVMVRLDEVADDAYLDPGQRLEEQLESVDYDVWLCPTCQYALTIPHKAWFSRFSQCPSCKRRTLESDTTTIIPATTVSTGLQEVQERCRNCSWSRRHTRVIPQIVTSSGSSSGGSSFGGGGGGGGGSSFGGGSAGGGGAGGRY
jgi:uncharacterized protein